MALIEAIVRRFPALATHSEATTGGRLTTKLSLATAQIESEYAELTRAGRMFSGIGVAAGAAPVQAIPTTAATHLLYNPDPKRSYVIVSVGAMILSGTPGTGATLWGIVSSITATLPTAATGSLIGNTGGQGLSSKAIIATAYTLPSPAGNAQWSILPGQLGQLGNGTAAASVGGLYSADVRGRVIVPPGRAFGLVVLSGVGTTPLFVPTFTWYEAEEDLE